MLRTQFIAIALLLLAAQSAAAKERVWTDSAGRTMRAEFVREVDGDVTFLRGGKLITIPLDKLTAADQQIVRDLAAGKPLPEETPATPQAGDFGSDAPAENSDTAESLGSEKPAAAADAGKPLIRTPIPIENRTWTDIHGNQTTARYVRIFASNVVLSRSGRSVTVKFYELIESDQQYLRELLTSHGQEAMIPPKTAVLDSGNEPAGNSRSTGGDSAGDLVPRTEALGPSQNDFKPPMPVGDPNAPGGIPATSSVPAGTSARSPAGNGASPYAPSTSSGSASAATTTGAPIGMSTPSASPNSGAGSGYTAPGYGSSAPPMYNNFSGPLRINQPADPVIGVCSSCKVEITRSQSSADNCPHCGIHWSYKQDQATRQKLPFPKLNAPVVEFDPQTSRTIAIVLGSFVGLLVVVGLIIGVMYAVMGLASVSSANRDQRYTP